MKILKLEQVGHLPQPCHEPLPQMALQKYLHSIVHDAHGPLSGCLLAEDKT